MKQKIYSLLAATLMLAGAATWSGCSSNDPLENGSINTENSTKEVNDFSFSLKGMNANTRATVEELTKDAEKAINTMYVAFFVNDGGTAEGEYLLHRIFALDGNVSFGDDASNPWKTNTEIVNTSGNYKIEKPGTVGDYVVYFIANPDADMKAEFGKFQLSGSSGADYKTRIKLSDFEALKAASGTADGTNNGFIMLAKENVTLGNPATQEITLTRLAARFDFINSVASSGKKVEITGIKIINAAQASRLMELAEPSNEEIEEQKVTVGEDIQTDPTKFLTAYTYENMNLSGANASKRLSIQVSYKLKSGDAVDGTDMTKTIALREGDTDLIVQRNHIYRIFMNGVTGEFVLQVQDWNEGATVTVPDESLAIDYTANDLGKIGDYVYNNNGTLDFSDGGLRRMDLYGNLTWESARPAMDATKGTCIGVVFSNATSKTDYEAGYTRGYIVCNTYHSSIDDNAPWKEAPYNVADDNLPKITTIAEAFADLDGRAHTEQFITNGIEKYKKLKSFIDIYDTYPLLPPTGISKWYVPSIGQWLTIAKQLGRVSLTGTGWNNSTEYERGWVVGPKQSPTFVKNLLAIFNSAGGNADLIGKIAINVGWETSSEASSDRKVRLVISGNNDIRINPILKDKGGYLLPVAAF